MRRLRTGGPRCSPPLNGARLTRMTPLRARVHNGRLVLDEPTALPEGTVLELVADDQGDDLDADEIAARDAAITKAWQSVLEGRGRPASQVLEALRRR
jgi:hypothetical protein